MLKSSTESKSLGVQMSERSSSEPKASGCQIHTIGSHTDQLGAKLMISRLTGCETTAKIGDRQHNSLSVTHGILFAEVTTEILLPMHFRWTRKFQ